MKSVFSHSQALLLFSKYLRVALPVRIEALLLAVDPGRFQLGTGEVPIRAAFLQDRPQIRSQLFDGRSAKEPISVINLVNHEAGFEYDGVRFGCAYAQVQPVW